MIEEKNMEIQSELTDTKVKAKYKIIKEYDRFYLTEHPVGYKVCFDRYTHKPTLDGYIIEKESNYTGGQGCPPEKVNRAFNLSHKMMEV